jgi:hypothetical protein
MLTQQVYVLPHCGRRINIVVSDQPSQKLRRCDTNNEQNPKRHNPQMNLSYEKGNISGENKKYAEWHTKTQSCFQQEINITAETWLYGLITIARKSAKSID